MREFYDGAAIVVWDTNVRGLNVRTGKHRTTFSFLKEHRARGKRSTTSVTLGHAPEMTITDARKAALVEAGRVAAGRITPGKRSAVKFEAAFTDYLDHLQRKADKAGKPARWRTNVEHIGRTILLPEFGKWSLAELSNSPAVVARFHRRVTKENGPVQANHAARILRATYRRSAKLDRSLPPHVPTSAVEFNDESGHDNRGLAFKSFPAWRAALDALPPIHRAYHMTCLLTGGRPGEIARLKWSDVECRTLVIRAAKAGQDIRLPMSIAIVRALKIARREGGGSDQVFPGITPQTMRDDLPARGVMLRRTYRTIADDCGVSELHAHFLMGHAPEGISQRYISQMILQSGPALRAAQRKISARIVGLLAL